MDFIFVISIVFIAFLIRSTFGFADAMVGMPLLAVVIGVHAAAPLMALLALIMAILMLLKNRTHVNFKVAWKLILAALTGVPIGLLYLVHINESIINLVLGVFVITFALTRLFGVRLSKELPDFVTWIVGFIGGILGGAYNTNGPPVIMLLSAKGWSPQVFRSTLQSYFLFSGMGVVVGHLVMGNIDSVVFKYFLAGLPAILLAFLLGEYWFKKVKSEKFYRWVYILLLVIGAGLIGKVLVG